jgi:hypothetical protein
MFLRLINNDQRLVVGPFIDKHRLIESEPNPATAVRAAKQIAVDAHIALTRHLIVTDRAGRNVPEIAVGTYCREDGSHDIAAVLASLANWLSNFLHFDAIVVTILAQHSAHVFWVTSGELKIDAFLFVAVCTV